MKKAITIFLAVALMLSLVACGGNGNQPNNKPISDNEEPVMQGDTTPEATPEIKELSLGDTITTDFMEFTLDNAQLSIAIETDNFTPVEYSPNMQGYVAAKGHTFVVLDFTIKNIDRVKYLYAITNASGMTERYLDFEVEYKGNIYTALSSQSAADNSVRYLMSKGDDGLWEMMTNLTSHILDVEETKSIRCYFDIPVEVDSVSDTFNVKVQGISDTFVVTASNSNVATK